MFSPFSVRVVPVLAAALLLEGGLTQAVAESRVIFAPSIEGKDPDGFGAFAREAVETILSDSEEVELLDRRLGQALVETRNREVEQGALDSQLKVAGADFAVYPKITVFGEHLMLTYRVVDLATTQYKSVMVKGDAEADPMDMAFESSEKILEGLESLGVKRGEKPAKEKTWQIKPGVSRVKFALRIPESSTSDQTADPAADKRLTYLLKGQGFPVVQLSRPSQSVTREQAIHLEGKKHEELLNEAKDKEVKVLIVGTAVSEQATRLGGYHVAKARVELNAVRVKNSQVIATTSGYGMATDLGAFVAEKKALEDAVDRLGRSFIDSIAAEL